MGIVGAQGPLPDEPPASAEKCLIGLAACVRAALAELCKEGCEGSFLEDAAMLVSIVERRSMRGVDVEKHLQRLWAEVALADETKWQAIADGAYRSDELVAETGLYRIFLAWWRPHITPQAGSHSLPYSANIDKLCGAYKQLEPLAPALRL